MIASQPQPTSERRIHLRDIAERAGVSISTVSRVLNNVVGITETVRQRVLTAADELGYTRGSPRPGSALQKVSLLTSLPLAPSIDPFHADVINGVEMACNRAGLHLSYASFGNGSGSAEMVLSRLQQNAVEGLLLLSIDDPSLTNQIRALGLPSVMINIDRRDVPLDTFLPDNEQGTLLAMQHLLAQGHQRILHITWPIRRTIQRRTEAYRAVLAEAGIAYDPQLLIAAALNAEDVYQQARRWLAQSPPAFTAAFCGNDMAALGLMRALQEAGLRVPQDVSVIGFDDIATAAFFSPPLTTVRIEVAELAELAVRRLIDRAANPALSPIRVSLACRLIERQSVCRPRAQR